MAAKPKKKSIAARAADAVAEATGAARALRVRIKPGTPEFTQMRRRAGIEFSREWQIFTLTPEQVSEIALDRYLETAALDTDE